MSEIEKIDKNLAVEKGVEDDGLEFFDVCAESFNLCGVTHDDVFLRLPRDVAKSANEGVAGLCEHTAGGCVHFVTNSKKIAIKCTMQFITEFPHMPATGVRGFDIYIDNAYYKTFVPPLEIKDGYESCVEFETGEKRAVTINFPLYNGVKDLYIGLEKGATCEYLNPYKYDAPIVYYGSSITQGGCASRPGRSYEAIISRKLLCEHLNLGFSGSAKGEAVIAEYIANLNMLALVIDYDYNAPTARHLKDTHERFFNIIREKNPDLPVVFVSGPNRRMSEVEERYEVIKTTYENAKNSGDENVYLIKGTDMFADDEFTVDDCHPTDYGFAIMAEKIGAVLENIIQ